MNYFKRFYNQNRKQIWMYILIIGAAITILQVVNSYAKVVNQKNKEIAENKDNSETKTIYNSQNYAVITSEYASEQINTTFADIIEKFVNYCNTGNIDEAYNMLSRECKQELYETKDEFKNKYYADIFSEKRLFSAQLWIKDTTRYTYRVTFTQDLISTGKVNELEIEDYYTIIRENGEYKLNINNFVGKETINKSQTTDKITIYVLTRKIFMNYEKYEFNIENGTDNNIALYSGEQTNKVYIQDANGLKYIAHMYELLDYEIQINAKGNKTVTIKFEKQYKPSIKEKKIVFEDIVLNYNDYLKNESSPRKAISVEL